MATVEFRYDPKSTAWFTANAAMVLKAGEPAYHDTTGLFKLGDGVTALSALSFLPTVSTATPTIQQVLTAGQVATTTIETTGFIKTGGLATEFLKADGTVDSSTYLTTLGTAATSLTTTGSSGAATLIANVLNVPNYTLAGLGGTTLAAVNAQNLSVFAATTSSQLAGVISDETGSGALVFGTSPTFTTGITTPLINGTSGTLQIGTTDLVNIGNKVTTNQRLVRIGQDTASADLGSLVGTSTAFAMYTNQINPNTINYTLLDDTSSIYLNGKAGNSLYFQIATTNVHRIGTNFQLLTPTAATSGSVIKWQLTIPSDTGMTASTNIPNFRITGANKQWATGTVANQYWNYLTANTASFVGASTITNSYGLFVEAATAGTNATITNNYAFGTNGNVIFNTLGTGTGAVQFRGLVGTTSQNAMYLGVALGSETSSNYTLNWSGSLNINSQATTSAIDFQQGSQSRFTMYGASSSGANQFILLNPSVKTGITASTETPTLQVNNKTQTWAAGNITNQRDWYLKTQTYAFASASTITNSYGLYVEAATAGTNATITNNWGIGFTGGLFKNSIGNTVLSNAALATNATNGFLYVPSCAGIPTGVPTSYTGTIPIVVDSTNNRMYIYSGGSWVALN